MDGIVIGLGVVALVIILTVMYFVPLGLWIAAWSSGAFVGILGGLYRLIRQTTGAGRR